MSIFLLLAAVAAVTDWIAVGRGWTRVEEVAKPLVPLGLILWVASYDESLPSSGVLTDAPRLADATPWVVAALVFGLIGDVLLLPRVNQFIGGLAVFLVGHLAYLPPLLARRDGHIALGLATVVLGAAAVTVGRKIVTSAFEMEGAVLAGAVAAYVTVVAAIAITSVSTLIPLIAVGGVLFATSDAAIGWGRFVARDDSRARRVFIHATYHLAQGGLASLIVN